MFNHHLMEIVDMNIPHFLSKYFLILVLPLTLSLNTAHAYVVGGAGSNLVPGSGCWAWDSTCVADFRGALENPAYFGPAGIVEETITTVTLNTVNSSTLSGIDMFIAPWISDADGATFGADVLDFFLSGGDLFLLDDSAGWDFFGQALGVPTTLSTGSVSNGGAPLFDGAFGLANDVTQHYQVGQLSAADIAANGGHIGGTNEEGQVTSAYWTAGEYAAGAGSLFIIADVDMIATTSCGLSVCGATYDILNDNGIYALNTFSFLKDNGGSDSANVAEPSSIAILLAGFFMLLVLRNKKVEQA
jgi:hypothetical protein